MSRDGGHAAGARQCGSSAASKRGTCSSLEVDAHHDPAEGRPTDLGEAGGGEDAAAANMELSPDDLLPGLRDHRVALEGTGTALPGEVDGGARERTADPAAPEARAGDEAGHSPDAVVGLVLGLARPGDAAEALGHSVELVTPDSLQAAHGECYATAMSGGRGYSRAKETTVPARCRNGTTMQIRGNVSVLQDKSGRVTGAALIVRLADELP